jgi:hypothetical protein
VLEKAATDTATVPRLGLLDRLIGGPRGAAVELAHGEALRRRQSARLAPQELPQSCGGVHCGGRDGGGAIALVVRDRTMIGLHFVAAPAAKPSGEPS